MRTRLAAVLAAVIASSTPAIAADTLADPATALAPSTLADAAPPTAAVTLSPTASATASDAPAAAGMVAASDTLSDAPSSRVFDPARLTSPASYDEALQRWHSAEDVNAWIGARFEYDLARAMLLSETQRATGGRIAIHAPASFFTAPRGVCVDLSRFAVETLRAIDPGAKAAYLMIEFAPVSIAGNLLRRHWVASFERDGQHYFFADSKRPGVLAGPYASVASFVDEYARYRGREVVSFRQLDSYERKTRTLATKRMRETGRDAPDGHR